MKVYAQDTDRPAIKSATVEMNGGLRFLYMEKAEIDESDYVVGIDVAFDMSNLHEEYSKDYPGLVNMGMTCYMNSYLQTLFHIKLFVREILSVHR